MTRIVIMAGGTGGHVFPALAVARELKRRGAEILWIGTRAGIEGRVVPAAGFDCAWIRIKGLRRQQVWDYVLLPFRMLLALWQSWRAFRRFKPDAALAMGGFVAGPGGLMARLTRTPLVVHEQNARAGFTNRHLAVMADRVLSGFPATFDIPGAQHVGNPVRADILALPAPAVRFAEHKLPLRVLIVGGSQGARIFNRVLPEALTRLAPEFRPQLWHQTGKLEHGKTEAAYHRAGIEARVAAFIEDMAAAYAWADVVICRAGAMTIAELAAAGLGAVLVPYPFATDDHQTANAEYLVSREAAILIPEAQFDAQGVADLLARFTRAPQALQKLAHNARACAVPDATARVADACLEAAHA